MNKIILLITLFICTCTCFAQNESINPTLDTMRAVQKRLYVTYSIKPFTGESIRYFPESGKKELEVPYVNGIPVGEDQEWYDNGNIKLVGTIMKMEMKKDYFRNGIKMGFYTFWATIKMEYVIVLGRLIEVIGL